jgi:hypothetical protein
MSVPVQISIGELYDKHSILEIKLEKIKDIEKREWIQKEYDLLNFLIIENPISTILKEQIKKINLLLWDIEEDIREKDNRQEFDNVFIEMARKVYQYNDERSRIKQQINIETKSSLRDIKSYI